MDDAVEDGVGTGATPPGSLEAYSYDKTGDRLSASLNGAAATPYSYTIGTHRLASVGSTLRSYDPNGNTQTGVASGFTFTYDDKNRFATATQGSATYSYQTNGRGERVRKGIGTTYTEYVYDESGQLLGEYNGSGVAQVEYLYLDGVPVGVNSGGVRYYVETDHLGTPRQVIDPARNVAVWTWDALASTFGANSPDPNPDGDGSKFAFNLRFPGQYYDAETGLNYNLARDYEAGTGRYVESDPIGLSSGINTYNYVGQNPLQRSDPTGRFWGELIVGGGIVGGTCAVIWCFKHTFEECARQYPDRRENRVSQSGFSICIKNPASICKLLMWLVEPAGEAAKLPAETANDHPEPTSCSECGGK